MIRIDARTFIDDADIEESFVRASGPGGQNVNKVSTAVQLRFDARRAAGLPEETRERLMRLGGRRVSNEGILIIQADRFRTRERNRADALDRLIDLVRRATERPKPRRPTRPTNASRVRRLDSKRVTGANKSLRRPPRGDD